jgi:hypothetical protein
MKHIRNVFIPVICVLIGLVGVIVIGVQAAPKEVPLTAPAGTAFTYQGYLKDAGAPASGLYDFEFELYDDPITGTPFGSTLNLQDVTVEDGVFTVGLDFGDVFDGTAMWLEIFVRPGASTGGYQQLLPRQALTAAPFAAYAKRAPWSGLDGVPAGFADGFDDDTNYSGGLGLWLDGTEFNVVFGGSGSESWVARSDHDHIGDTWESYSLSSLLSIKNYQDGGTGIWGVANGIDGTGLVGTGGGVGVKGIVTNGKSIYGVASGTSATNFGVYGETHSSGGYGGMFVNTGGGALIAADDDLDHGDLKFRVSNVGNVFADGSFTGGGADFAEMLPSQSGLKPGEVVCMGADGSLALCSSSYDPGVVGVYSTEPGFVAGGRDQEQDHEGRAPIAMMGVVPVKASAENGSIGIGDLLVSASQPGYAMRCEGVEACFGRVIGKALEALGDGTGLIQMLVMPH